MPLSNIPQKKPRPGQIETLIASINLRDCVKKDVVILIDAWDRTIRNYLIDYFLLVNDLKTLKEGTIRKRVYYDYSFLLLPIHKALEAFLINMIEKIFLLKVSRKRSETIGYYMKIVTESEKKKIIKKISQYYGLLLNEKKWLSRWTALSNQWEDNRNRVTHVKGEKLETLQQAEQVAHSILREINISGDLVREEILDPIIKRRKESP